MCHGDLKNGCVPILKAENDFTENYKYDQKMYNTKFSIV